MDYPIVVVALSDEDGGGYLGFAPDLMGCMSDGETPGEAAANTEIAVSDWLEECERVGRDAPEPGSAAAKSKEERKKLVEMIHLLSEMHEDLDGQMERLADEVERLKAWMEANTGWQDFAKISHLGFVGKTKGLPYHA